MATAPANGHTTRQGHALDNRLAAIFDEMERQIGALHIYQGCWNTSIAASGNTHFGCGAIDVRPNAGQSFEDVEHCGRDLGLAIWHRLPSEGPWVEHCHGIEIGASCLSAPARSQVQDYYAGLNGLATHYRDTSWRPSIIVPFTYPLPHISFANVRTASEASKPPYVPGVKRVQMALNTKTGAGLLIDGLWGPVTAAAYKRYEKQQSAQPQDIDGLPGTILLQKLGNALYVVDVNA